MAKRKREQVSREPQSTQPAKPAKSSKKEESSPSQPNDTASTITLQIVTGSYERVLHGFTTTINSTCLAADYTKSSSDDSSQVQFVDTFLFEAHSSAIKSLALSPLPNKESTEPPKVMLASGGSDERVNLYTLSAAPPTASAHYPTVPTLAGNKILENPKNRELGALLHHSAPITALSFPSRSKLLASSEDNSISVNRTRDLTVISTIKAPRPKVQGRPSGDTAPPGGSPSGVNDFAVHPSMKLMLSVGKGEKCMRLWNLVTGKKAGVLNFNKEILQSVKEGRWSTGEGRKIAWNSEGEEFAVAFEWGAVLFGIDSTPTCRILPTPRSKVHGIKYVPIGPLEENGELVAVSTEDGRVIFYSTKKLQKPEEDDESSIPYAKPVAQIGGKSHGFPGRVKDFEILSLDGQPGAKSDDFAVVTANSEGVVRVWHLLGTELRNPGTKNSSDAELQVGKLLKSYETGNRITCLKAFVMMPAEHASMLEDLEESFDEGSEVESSSEGSEV
ncbi:60S ribosome biogenesis protein Mak11, partial [Aspergillus pseudoustus]